jgi:hypothetical protein
MMCIHDLKIVKNCRKSSKIDQFWPILAIFYDALGYPKSVFDGFERFMENSSHCAAEAKKINPRIS